MSLLVGLTGGIASGKSTVARMLAGLGCFVIDADGVVGDLYRPGRPGHAAVMKRYGPEVVTPEGQIDRRRLADRAFRDPASAAELNALIHPLVIEEERSRIAAEEKRSPVQRIIVVEATLLLEAGGRARYDRIIVVDSDQNRQIERGVGRGMEEADVRRRIANQMPAPDRLLFADYVIANNGDLSDLERQTNAAFTALRKDLAEERFPK